MKRLIGGAVVAGIAIFAGVGAFGDDTVRDSTGAVVEGGGVGAFVIRNGDCINVPDETLVASVEAVPCSDPHDAEVYLLFDMTEGSYPGEATITSTADNGCLAQFHPFVGLAYEQSALDITWLAPTEDSWNDYDDREITCMVYAVDGSKLTGSMRGSGR